MSLEFLGIVIAFLALFVSLASLFVSSLALFKDRAVVKANAVAVQGKFGPPQLNINVTNKGKRPISITHILLKRSGTVGKFICFSERIEVGDIKATQLDPLHLPKVYQWNTLHELHNHDVFVVDSNGARHKATFHGKKSSWSWPWH